MFCAYCGLIGCQAGDENASQSAQAGESIAVTIVAATVANLPACTASLAGTVAYVTSTSTLYACSSNTWRSIACTTSNAGDVAYASTPQTLLACVAKKWTPIAAPQSSLVAQHAEPAGSHCANGGVRIDTGLDANGNHVLDASEIQQTSYVCNGRSGSAGTGAGSGGTTGGSGGTGGTSGGPPCLTAGKDLVLIGDSYVNYINNLEPKLTQHARAVGGLSASDHFADYAVAGAALASGTPLIGSQWTTAKNANAGIKFAVMDGGGSDIWISNAQCLQDGVGSANDPSCQKVMTDALAAANTIVTSMKASGVREVVYFFYPHTPVGGNDIFDWAFPMFKSMCEGASGSTFHCRMLDTRTTFNGHPEYFDSDGLNPSAAGAQALADSIWSTLTTQCIAQPASSGCCTP